MYLQFYTIYLDSLALMRTQELKQDSTNMQVTIKLQLFSQVIFTHFFIIFKNFIKKIFIKYKILVQEI